MSADQPGAATIKRVLVLSYLDYHNFGDRLGVPIINALLPANLHIVHAPLRLSKIPEGDFDLLILGLGQSLNAPAIAHPALEGLLDRIPHRIGIFGTQYPSQYQRRMEPARFGALLDRLTTWWARYEADIRDYGGGRANVRHLGDWLISAFPMTGPRWDKSLTVEAKSRDVDAPLDRTIQWVQAYRRVMSARLHPLLCALTSAEQVSYREQREIDDHVEMSGKFEAMLTDIFGRTFPEDELFDVDRDAVLRYKIKVETNMAALRRQITDLLA
jgi:hypothetical protein